VKVGLVSSLDRGGPVEHSLVLTRGLVERGDEVVATCASSQVAARFEALGARALVIPLRHQLDGAGGVRVRRALRGVDVVHGQDRRAGLWTRSLPRVRGAALVYTIHGLPDPYLPPPAGVERPGWRAVLAYRGVDAALGRRADALITPSQAMASVLVSRLGLPAGKLHVVPNAIELGPPPSGAGDAVGSLSSLEPVKGLEVLLEAFARLGRPQLAARSARLGLDGSVSFPGFVASREALAQLRVFAMPSVMENSPMALLEAMAAGVPAVASRVGGVPETAPEGTAQLVPPGDPGALAEAIARLLDDPALARAQAAAARAHVETNASPEVMARRTMRVYEAALHGDQGRSS
jgi:glycosyltransferase involved in cell wall biosynthesis